MVQPGPGGGVGAAAGAAWPAREGQHVLGAPRAAGDRALLGQRLPPCVRRRPGGQGVLPACRLHQAGQGTWFNGGNLGMFCIYCEYRYTAYFFIVVGIGKKNYDLIVLRYLGYDSILL